MAVVTSPTLPFNNLERHEISNALESSTELRYPVSSSNNDSLKEDRYLVWQEVMGSLRELAKASNYSWKEEFFYIVVFRSRVPPETVAHYSDLGALDKAAHAEATESGGFLKYWFGVPDKNGRNLATCVWRNSRDAKIGSVGPHHRVAANAARHMYTEWKIERLRLLVKDDVKGWEIEQWID